MPYLQGIPSGPLMGLTHPGLSCPEFSSWPTIIHLFLPHLVSVSPEACLLSSRFAKFHESRMNERREEVAFHCLRVPAQPGASTCPTQSLPEGALLAKTPPGLLPLSAGTQRELCSSSRINCLQLRRRRRPALGEDVGRLCVCACMCLRVYINVCMCTCIT